MHCGSERGVWASGRGHGCWVVSMTRALTFKDSGRRLSPGSTQPSTELRPEEAGRPICRPFSILIVPAWSTKHSRNRRQHWLPQKYACRTLQGSHFRHILPNHFTYLLHNTAEIGVGHYLFRKTKKTPPRPTPSKHPFQISIFIVIAHALRSNRCCCIGPRKLLIAVLTFNASSMTGCSISYAEMSCIHF